MNAAIAWARLEPEPLWQELDGLRFYRVPDDPAGRALPAVSTVLRETGRQRFALDAWERKLGREHADMVRDIAIARGRKLHRKIAGLLLHGQEPEPDPTDVWWQSVELVVRQLATAGRTLLCEGAVLDLLGGFAGTPDDVVEIGGRIYVVDWKTAAEERPIEILQEHEEQVAGYVDAIAAHYGVRPTHGLVVVALPRKHAQVHTVNLDRATPAWRARLDAFYG